MNETNQPNKAKKKTMITIAVLAVVVIIAILVIVFVNKKTDEVTPEAQPGDQTPVVSEEGEGMTEGEGEIEGENLEGGGEVPEVLKDAREIAPGTNLVTKDNIVVTDAGEPVKMNIDPASHEAPKESQDLAEEDVPDDEFTVKLNSSTSGFSPNTFTVSTGQLVNLVLTSTDDYVHIIKFEDENLFGALLGVAGGETKMKSWNAPTTPGEYRFFCSVPGHERRGEVGVMVVE
ncbi:MAG: cupredoxin domain-containing protein [Patescibacteria group bacterium]|jgi:plastocyanin|nr:cupredoxin domain-containing protein [Patescibacteria group bacterium]